MVPEMSMVLKKNNAVRPAASPPRAGPPPGPRRILPVFLAILFAMCAPPCVLGQPALYGARSAALAGASAALPDDAAGQGNPAAWAQANARTASLHGAQWYGLPELRSVGVRLVAPIRQGAVSGSVSAFGFDLYRHITATGGYARGVGFGSHRRAYAGIRAEWNQVYIAHYGQPGAMSLTGGVLFPVTPFVSLGAVAYRLTAFAGPLRSELSRRLAAGAFWTPSAALAITTDVAKEIRAPLSVSAGLEIRMVDALILRGGFASGPRRTTGGVGLRTASIRADFAIQKHDLLGWSPSMSLHYSW